MFVFSAVAAIVSAVLVAASRPRDARSDAPGAGAGLDRVPAGPERRSPDGPRPTSMPTASGRGRALPTSLWNRGLIAVIVINAGGYYAGGTYEVIWSLYLDGLGADLALIGFTFAMFGLPVLLFSPIAGRIVDRRGSFAFIIIGSILPAVTGILYTLLADRTGRPSS